MPDGLIELIVFDFLIVSIPLLMYRFPPEKTNAIYGYRSKRASKDDRSWQFAQNYFSRRWLFIPFMVIASQIIMVLSGLSISSDPPIVPLISIAEFLIGSIFCIYSTELALKNQA